MATQYLYGISGRYGCLVLIRVAVGLGSCDSGAGAALHILVGPVTGTTLALGSPV